MRVAGNGAIPLPRMAGLKCTGFFDTRRFERKPCMRDYLGLANSHIKSPRPSTTGPSMTDENLDASTHDTGPASLLALTAQIVAAYTGKNATPGSDLPVLIDRVFQSLAGLATGSTTPALQARPEPAVPVKRSVFADYIVCLEDGKKLKMLKRHLMTSYSLTPQAYRERWGLPSDYPMVAPAYAEKRSALAKSIGLGRKRGGGVAATATVEMEAAPEEVTPIPKTRGRKLAKPAEAAGE